VLISPSVLASLRRRVLAFLLKLMSTPHRLVTAVLCIYVLDFGFNFRRMRIYSILCIQSVFICLCFLIVKLILSL
jgi:hypothetical protein